MDLFWNQLSRSKIDFLTNSETRYSDKSFRPAPPSGTFVQMYFLPPRQLFLLSLLHLLLQPAKVMKNKSLLLYLMNFFSANEIHRKRWENIGVETFWTFFVDFLCGQVAFNDEFSSLISKTRQAMGRALAGNSDRGKDHKVVWPPVPIGFTC